MPTIFALTSQRLAIARQHQDAAQQWATTAAQTPLTHNIVSINRTYPHIPAPAVMALAAAGYGSDAAETKAVADLQLKRDAEDEHSGLFKSWGDLVDSVKDTTKIGLSALNAPWEFGKAGFREGVKGAQTGDFRRMAYPFGLAGFAANADRFKSSAEQTQIGAAIQVAHNTPGVSVSEALNDVPQLPDDRDPARLLDQSGSSWLPGVNSLATRQQNRNIYSRGLTVDGRATTYGRAAANAIGLEPGTRWYNAFTGYIDLSMTLSPAGDPVGAVGATLANANRARRVFQGATRAVDVPQAVRITAKVTDKATGKVTHVPITVNGSRKTVVFENAHDWLMNSKEGDRAVTWLSKETDFERIRKALGPHAPLDVVLKLQDETDPARMKQVLLEELSKDFIDGPIKPTLADQYDVGMPVMGGKVAALGSATFRRPTARWRQYLPSDTLISRDDPAWSVEQFDRWQRYVRKGALKDVLSHEQISKNNEALARALTSPVEDELQTMSAITKTLEDALASHGIPRSDARRLTRLFSESREKDTAFWTNAIGQNVKHSLARVGGQGEALPSPHASQELLNSGITLPEPQELLQYAGRWQRLIETRNSVAAREALQVVQGAGHLAVDAADLLTNLFKVMVLPMRGPAFALRNVSEEQARMTVSGLEGAFNSPLSYVAWLVGEHPNGKVARALGKSARVKARGGVDINETAFATDVEDGLRQFQRAMEDGPGPWMDVNYVGTGSFQAFRRGEPEWLDANRRTLALLAASPEYREVARAERLDDAKEWFWRSPLREKMANAHRRAAGASPLDTRAGADTFMDEVAKRIEDATGGHPELRQAIAHNRLKGVELTRRNGRGHVVGNEKARLALRDYEDHLPEYAVGEKQISLRQGGGGYTKAARAGEQVIERLFYTFGARPNNRFTRSPAFRQKVWASYERMLPLASEEAKAKLLRSADTANMPRAMKARLAATPAQGHLNADDLNLLAQERAFRDTLELFYDSHDKQNWTRTLRLVSPFAAAVQDMARVWTKQLWDNPLMLHRVQQGMAAAHQSGFFYTDENGEERFVYPFSRAFTQLATGVPVPMTGSVRGANMVTSGVIPSFGPAVTMPAGWLLPDKPETDNLRKAIFPYGESNPLLPSWLKKVGAMLGMGSAEDKRLAQAANADTMGYLATTGKYNLSDPEDLERLRHDAKEKGQALYLIRALFQAGAPAAPSFDWMAKDDKGRLVAASKMAADMRRFYREDPDNAVKRLFGKYGDAVFYVTTGQTEGGGLTTEQAHDLIRKHPDLGEHYPDVWSLFTDPDSPFSYEEYKRQIAAGEKRPLELEEVQRKAQTSIAWMIYRQYKEQVGPFPNADEMEWLRGIKTRIRKDFPLWQPEDYDATRIPKAIAQIEKAVKDPAIRGTDAAQGAKAYLYYRQQAIASAKAGGLTSFTRAKSAENVRDWLRGIAGRIVQDHPGFAPLWDRVFEQEMIGDADAG